MRSAALFAGFVLLASVGRAAGTITHVIDIPDATRTDEDLERFISYLTV